MDKGIKEKRIERIMHCYARAIIEMRDKTKSEMKLYWNNGAEISLLGEEERIVKYALIAKKELLKLLK